MARPATTARPRSNVTASAIAGKPLGRDMGDHASHMGPRQDAFSHARYSTEWIKEAFDPQEPEFQDSRMRIMVAFAVENEAMCEQLYYANKGNGGPGSDGYPCSKGDSFASLERQINAIKAWVGENRDWMEIAYTSADARRIVNADKLAVILGVGPNIPSAPRTGRSIRLSGSTVTTTWACAPSIWRTRSTAVSPAPTSTIPARLTPARRSAPLRRSRAALL